jgi:hypothetical protein
MTRRTLSTLAVTALLLAPAAPAWADRYDRDRGRDCDWNGHCQDDSYGGQGNRNRQDRHQGHDDNHKSFSPDLKDSPVTICMPGSTCNFDGNGQPKKGDDGQGQQPS